MSLFLIILLRLAELVPVTLPQYSLQICHPHACWLPIDDALCNFRSVDFRNQFHWNFQPTFTAQLSGDLRWFLSPISTPTIPPLYVYHLVFGRSSETNGVGKQHWWDWGRGNIPTCSWEDNLIAWRSPWKHWGDPYLKTNCQHHRVE